MFTTGQLSGQVPLLHLFRLHRNKLVRGTIARVNIRFSAFFMHFFHNTYHHFEVSFHDLVMGALHCPFQLGEFYVWRYLIILQGPQMCWAQRDYLRPPFLAMCVCQVFQFLKIKYAVVTSWDPSALEHNKHKSTIGCKELSIPENPAYLDGSPTSTYYCDQYKNHPSGCAMPCPVCSSRL